MARTLDIDGLPSGLTLTCEVYATGGNAVVETITLTERTIAKTNYTGTIVTASGADYKLCIKNGASFIGSATAYIGANDGVTYYTRQQANLIEIEGTAQTARDIGASVLLSPGTGAGQVDITSGVVKANTTQFAGQTITAAAGVTIPASIASPTNITAATGVALIAKDSLVVRNGTAQAGAASTITLDASASAVDSFYVGEEIKLDSGTGAGQVRVITGYVGSTKVATVGRAWVTNPDATSVFTVVATSSAKLNSSLEVLASAVVGSVASVTGAVGSVTGSVGGNVTGSVGLIAAGGIVASSFAAGAIDAAAIATDAIGSSEIAASAVTKIQTGLATPTNITAGTITTATNVTTVNGLAAGVITAASIAADAITDAKVAADVTIASVTGAVGSVTAGVTLAASQHVIVDSGTVTTVTNQMTAAQIATAVWQDAVAGDFTAPLSVGKSLMNGVSLGTGLTIVSASGSVGSVTGNVGGNVVGSVASVTAAIILPTIPVDWITASGIATDAIGSSEIAASAVTKIQTGLATSATALSTANWTNARAGYLDNLNVGGVVASQADVQAINTSSSKHLILTTVGSYERPESGSTVYTVEGRTYAATTGAVVNADSTPTLTATGQTSGSLAANLSAASNPATGVYRWAYSVATAAIVEPVRFDISAVISGSTFTLSAYSQVVDEVSQTWTSTDASHLTAVFNKLPVNNIADETLLLAALGSPMQAGSTVVLTDASLTTAKLGAFALVKTTNITGFNDLSAAQVNTEADTALLDVGVTAIVTGRIDAAITSRSSHTAADVWAVATRSLTTFGTLASDVWAVAARTLTAFGFTPTPSNVSDTTAIKTKTDQLAFTVANQVDANTLSGGGMTAAQVRAAIGMVSANLDTQLDALPTNAELAAAVVPLSTTAASTANTTTITTAVGTRASQTSLDTLDDYVDTEVAAIKTQTDKLTFTVANQIDANVLDWKSATAPAMTGDAFARLGAPAGASVSADVLAVKADTGNLVTRITSTLFSGITSISKWLGLLAGKTADAGTLAEMHATTAGATFSNTTDSLESIRDRGDAAWITGSSGGGTGARSVTITVNDGVTVLQNATVRMTQGAESYSVATNVSGVSVFALDDATWTVTVTKAGYTHTPTTIIVNGTETATYSMTAVTITPSANSSLTTGHTTTYDNQGNIEAGVFVELRFKDFTSSSSGLAYDSAIRRSASKADGLVEFVGLFRLATYQCRRVGRNKTWTDFTALAAPSTPLPTLVADDS